MEDSTFDDPRRKLTNQQRIAYMKALRDVQAAKERSERARKKVLESLRRLRNIFIEHSKRPGTNNQFDG